MFYERKPFSLSLLLTAFVLALWIAILAVYRTVISGFKRDFAFFLTFCANRLVHLPWPAESTATTLLICHVTSHSYGHQTILYVWVPSRTGGTPTHPIAPGADLALSCNYKAFKKDCKCFFILRRPGHWGPAQARPGRGRTCHPIGQGALWPPSLFSPVFFVSFPLPSFSWTILSDTFYMNNYLLP